MNPKLKATIWQVVLGVMAGLLVMSTLAKI